MPGATYGGIMRAVTGARAVPRFACLLCHRCCCCSCSRRWRRPSGSCGRGVAGGPASAAALAGPAAARMAPACPPPSSCLPRAAAAPPSLRRGRRRCGSTAPCAWRRCCPGGSTLLHMHACEMACLCCMLRLAVARAPPPVMPPKCVLWPPNLSSCRQASRRWGSPSSQVPVVRFLHGREVPMGPAIFSAELAGVGSCMRTQIPLKLAYAITIHKCQVGTCLHACTCVRGVSLPCPACGHRQSPPGWQENVKVNACLPAHPCLLCLTCLPLPACAAGPDAGPGPCVAAKLLCGGAGLCGAQVGGWVGGWEAGLPRRFPYQHH